MQGGHIPGALGGHRRQAVDQCRCRLQERCIQITCITGNSRDLTSCACAASVQWVALHGYLDSAASFDQLAPLLTSASPGHAVLALDYPGHGRSSPLAPGQMYHLLECVKFVRMGG